MSRIPSYIVAGGFGPLRTPARPLHHSRFEGGAKARSAASKEFLETYNDNWREFSVRRADGSFEDVSNPTLTEAEFEQRLILDVVSIIGSDTVEFCYGDGELFSGHSIIVTSFDGTTFNDIHAALFG